MRGAFEFRGPPPDGAGKFNGYPGGEREWGEVGTTPRPAPARRPSTLALVRAIPDDPDYRRHVPLDYRLNAKQIVGHVAQDLSSRGRSAHFWVEIGHAGLVAAEIFAEASLLVSGLAIAGPMLGLAATGLALGAGYHEAGERIAADWAARGFSRGVVMGADKRRARMVIDYFANDHIPANHFFPRGRSIAAANYRIGLLVGYAQGRRLSENQRAIFWRDLGRRMGDQSHRGPRTRWLRRQWIDWYVTAAAVLRRHHLA